MHLNRRTLVHRACAEQLLEDVLFHLVDIAEEEDHLGVFRARRTPGRQSRLSLTLGALEQRGTSVGEQRFRLLVRDHFANEIEADFVDFQGSAAGDQQLDLLDVVLGREGRRRCCSRG